MDLDMFFKETDVDIASTDKPNLLLALYFCPDPELDSYLWTLT